MSNRPRMNPYGPPEHLFDGLPPSHPARERSMLTPYQAMAFPMLLWFFDTQRHRGEGRSTLMAHVAIELAMRGNRVPLEDLSQFLHLGGNYRNVRYFVDLVWRTAMEHYPEHIFEMQPRHHEAELRYVGRRPR